MTMKWNPAAARFNIFHILNGMRCMQEQAKIVKRDDRTKKKTRCRFHMKFSSTISQKSMKSTESFVSSSVFWHEGHSKDAYGCVS